MRYPDEYDDDDRNLFQGRASPPHSGVGVASFILSMLCGVGVFLLIVMAVIIEQSDPGVLMDERSPQAMLLGLGVLACGTGSLVGVILGIVGLSQSSRKTLFAVLGMVFNAMVLLGLALLCLIGLNDGGF
jgi:hypothetical protein